MLRPEDYSEAYTDYTKILAVYLSSVYGRASARLSRCQNESSSDTALSPGRTEGPFSISALWLVSKPYESAQEAALDDGEQDQRARGLELQFGDG